MNVLLFANTDWYLYNFRLSLARALKDAGHDVLLVSPPGPYGEKLRELGFRWRPVAMQRRSLNPLRELALLLSLRRLMREEKTDVVHGFTIKCAVYGSLAARAAGIPARISAVAGMGYVFTSNDLKAKVLRPVVRTLLRFALGGSYARLVLQNADDVELFLRARLAAREQIRLIPGSGVDCKRFSPDASRTARAAGPLKVLLPARLLWDKGLAEYVEAARIVRAAGADVEFLLAGEPDPGNPAAVPDATLRSWVDEGVVRWLGQVQDMPALLRTVDAVVLPSYREGLPKGLIEAGAMGLPLVTTDVPGCRDVVTDGVDGLLVPVRDAPALAQAILRLQDEGLRTRLGAAARARTLARYEEGLVIARTLDVYEELLPGRFAPAAAAAEASAAS